MYDISTGDLVSSANANQSKPVDTISPYYLHLSDHFGLIFLMHPLSESGDNYFMWRLDFVNALHFKNKGSFTDGTIAKSKINSLDLQSWIQCNAMVLSWVTNVVDKELQGSTAHVKTTKEIWNDLEERFIQEIVPRVCGLKRAIAFLQ
ncbi:hypothetical protein RJ639_023497 [Escallonia herrerae]|uniref:Retrotransposon Copia-like N-terminal domain-containing protein n=1 Tax=Escallonia herrerae TaxID=1293975 RepID=A0AA89AE13_9ASTE|nr:hypothetical protein RJ639_023497 [Escallonia herrerae]